MIIIKEDLIKIDSGNWLLDEASNTPLIGGNKIRKLEYFLRNKSFDGILSFGSKFSSHCLAIAYFGAINNLTCDLLIIEDSKIEVKDYPHLQLAKTLGANLIFIPSKTASDSIDYYRDKFKGHIWVPGGGHTKEGLLAYKDLIINTFKNNKELQSIQSVYLPFGTGTTALGVAQGLAELNLPIKVKGISVSRTYSKCLEALKEFSPSPDALALLDIDDSFAGKYGVVYEEQKSLRLSFLEKTGYLLDPIYNVRVLEALKKDNPQSFLLINTGGQLNNLL